MQKTKAKGRKFNIVAQRWPENSWLPFSVLHVFTYTSSCLHQQSQNSLQQAPAEWVRWFFSATAGPQSWAKRLNAQIKHLVLEKGDDIFTFRLERSTGHMCKWHAKKQMFTPPRLRSTLVRVSLINPNIQQLLVLTQIPKEPQIRERESKSCRDLIPFFPSICAAHSS